MERKKESMDARVYSKSSVNCVINRTLNHFDLLNLFVPVGLLDGRARPKEYPSINFLFLTVHRVRSGVCGVHLS
jgi:hypothetical protein